MCIFSIFSLVANYIGCTVNGLGERAGNAALEEVLMALKFVYGYDTDVDTTKFVEICKYVSKHQVDVYHHGKQ